MSWWIWPGDELGKLNGLGPHGETWVKNGEAEHVCEEHGNNFQQSLGCSPNIIALIMNLNES